MSNSILSKNNKVYFVLFLIFILFALSYLVLNFNKLKNTDSDILSLLPEDTNQAIHQKIKILSKEAVNETIILISNKNPDDCIYAALLFQKSISNCEEFHSIRSLNTQEKLTDSKTLFEPFAHCLLPLSTKRILESKGLSGAIQQSSEKLQGPLSIYYQEFIEKDPLLNSPLYIQSTIPLTLNQTIYDDYILLKDNDEYFFVLQCTLKNSPFDQNAQSKIINALNTAEQNLKNKFNDAKVIKSGVLFFAERGNQIAKKEISIIGSSSIIGVLLLLLIIFRSIKPLALGLLSISCGIITGLFVSSLFFERLHIVTLTFGTSLIGASIDYAVHFFADHKTNSNDWGSDKCLKRILPGVSWGALTSILAFLALALNPLPGLHQIAIFSSAGILGAYLSVVLLLPKFYSQQNLSSNSTQSVFYDYSIKYFKILISQKYLLLILLLISAYALVNITINDDIKNLYSPPDDLKNNEQKVHKIFGQTDPSRLIIVSGPTIEDVLQKEEELCVILQKLKSEKQLGSYYALSTFLPSLKTQKLNQELLFKNINEHELKLSEDEKNIWYSINNAKPYRSTQIQNYLTPEVFLKSKFGENFKKLIHENNGQYFSIILPINLHDEPALKNALLNKTDILYINNRERISDSLKTMREKITFSTIIIYFIIFMLLFFKHGARKSLAIVTIPFISALLSLSILILLNQNIHIGHFLALIIVLGIGIDYTIFLAESVNINKATWLAITVSAMTTIISFGLLAFCQTEFLKAFGLTILLGVGLSYILSPYLYALTKNKDEISFSESKNNVNY